MSDHLRHGPECACNTIDITEVREQAISIAARFSVSCDLCRTVAICAYLEDAERSFVVCLPCVNEARRRLILEHSRPLAKAMQE